jgi:hypothetical protein
MSDSSRRLIRRVGRRILSILSILVVAQSLAAVTLIASQDSTIKGLTVAPDDANAGVTVTATATGSGLCGAVHIDWGDGTAITYATSTLPVTQTHVYKVGGTFNVRAQGMGNCTGQATARVKIAGPPPPPSPEPKLNAVELSATTVAPRTPVNIALRGTGTCRISLDFGDGNSQELSGALPLSVRHTYPVAGKYAIVATPLTPCGDRQTATLIVGAEPSAPRIDGVEINRPAGVGANVRAIRVNGVGRCAYTLDYGDGNSEGRNADLPDVVRHNYPAEGRYTVVATPAAPCTGAGQSQIVIGEGRAGTLSRIEVRPTVLRLGESVAVTLAGSGTCRFTVDFGDDRQRELTESLPYQLRYRYTDAGDYEIVAWTEAPCTGGGWAEVSVRR